MKRHVDQGQWWGGTRLRQWLLTGDEPIRHSALLSGVRARAFDLSLWLQEKLPAPPPLAEPPIFIMGLWRTGTTLAHEMLTSLSGTCAPTSWQCFRPASFRFAKPPTHGAVLRRPMDGLSVRLDSPQEDEFALMLLGVPSLYRGFLDPRRFDELTRMLACDKGNWLPAFDRFVRSIAAEASNSRVVIKSPNHLFRLETLRNAYPTSPIVVMLRDSRETYWSNLRMWRSMIDIHGIAPSPPGAIENFLVAAMLATAGHFNRLASADRSRAPIFACCFNEWAADPLRASSALAQKLGLQYDHDQMARRAAAVAATPGTRRDALPVAAQAAGAMLDAASQRLLDTCSHRIRP